MSADRPTATPSPWIVQWSHLVQGGGRVLDVACGSGRHVRAFRAAGHAVTGVDIAQAAVDSIAALGAGVRAVQADIEGGPWPFDGETFDAVIVTNYLWRPRLPDIVAAVAPGGVLLYETFARGQETIGKPSRPDFLLQPGELLAACAGMDVVAFENGFLQAPARFVQRIAAVRPLAGLQENPARHVLRPPAPNQ